jgi:hypothetical protein
MSRISKYQNSVNRFLKTKSCVSKNDLDNSDFIAQNIDKCDHMCAILLLTILNSHAKKNNLKIHGYSMACGIDILHMLVRLLDNRIYNEETFGKDKLKNICTELSMCVYKSLAQNIETIKYNMKDTSLKIYIYCSNYLNRKMYDITKFETFISSKKMVKSDVLTIKFTDNDGIKTKLQKMFKLDKDILIKKVETTYGYMCQCALVLGWILGGGDEKMVESLEKLGIHLGNMLKICYDFDNIENDIVNCTKITHNLVVNIGIQDSFRIFMDSKASFLEGCLTFGIYTNTTKEIIDLIESKIDKCIESANIDMKSTYSSFTR